MVQRTSQELNLNMGGAVTAQQSSTGNATPDPNKYATGTQFSEPTGAEDGTVTRLLSNLMGAGDKLAQQTFTQSTEEAYLSGVSKAGTIQSEAELNANPITKDWETAGYRDTMGRIAAADTEAQIAADMPKTREMSPADYADYLAEKRKGVVDSMAGMSIQARQSMLGQQMLNERAWIKKQQVEHYKFGVETEQRSIKSALDTSLSSLTSAKSDAAAYGAQTDATIGVAYQSIVANQKLPTALKGKMVAEFATYALENDHQQLYAAIHNRNVPMEDGSERPMASLMSWEDETALSKSFRESEHRTEAFRAADYMDRTAAMQADWSNPNSPPMPLEQVRQHLADGIQRKLVSADQYKTIMQDYYTSQEKKIVQSQLGQAWAAGDQNKLIALGKTAEEGLDAYVNTLGRKMQLPQLVDNLLSIGGQTGQEGAFKKVGQLMLPAFAQLGNNEKIDPANAVAVSGVLQKIDTAEKSGKAGAFHQFLSAFDPEVQAKITYMRDNLAKGNDPSTAIAAATARVLEDQQLTPAVRAELTASKAKDMVKTLDDLTPRGVWGTAMLYAKSFVGTQQSRATASATLAATPFQGWFENDDRVAQVMASTKLQVARSMDDISKANPHMGIDSVKSMALAEVSGRSVPTSWGPLIVPKGFNPQRYFGVGQDVGAERIGAALDEYIKPERGGRMAFSMGVNGELMYQELNDKGQPAAPARTIDPKAVGPMVDAQRQRVIDGYKANYGPGVTKTVNGIPLQYNGDNTANVDNAWMRGFRDDLVGHEGVRDTVYKDADGNDTIGVGFLVHHAKTDMRPQTIKVGPDGKVSAAQISETLTLESDKAAKTAVRMMGATGMSSQPAFKLYGSLAYQSGNGFSQLKAYKPLMQAIVAKDQGAATTALKASPAYLASNDVRKQYYLNNLMAAMKGM